MFQQTQPTDLKVGEISQNLASLEATVKELEAAASTLVAMLSPVSKPMPGVPPKTETARPVLCPYGESLYQLRQRLSDVDSLLRVQIAHLEV